MNPSHAPLWRGTVVGAPMLWLLLFFVVPYMIVLAISAVTGVDGNPPYASPLDPANLTLDSYRLLASDDLYIVALLNSLRIAAVSTAFCLLIGYPMAYAIARAPARSRGPLLMLVILPFWTSFLIRVYAWIILLRPTGLLNTALQTIGLIDEPLELIANQFAVHLGIVYSYLPFMVLPLYAALERLDPAMLEAAYDLGCKPSRAFWKVTVPLSLPGIIAGCLLVFIPAVGEFVIPDLLGGPDTPMIGRVLWSEFFSNRDWPVASAVATALLVILVAPIILFQAYERRATEGKR